MVVWGWAGSGQPPHQMVRLHPNGSLDDSFLADAAVLGPDSVATILAPQPDGQLLVAGYLNGASGEPQHGLLRLHADGSHDTSFDPSISGYVAALTVLPDGAILIGGDFTVAGVPGIRNLARLNGDGSILAPAVSTPPQSRRVTAGEAVTLSVGAAGSGLSYQWYRDGEPIPGATGAQCRIESAQTFHAGAYTARVTNDAGSVTSAAAVLTVEATAAASSRLLNVSNRGRCGTRSQVLITGFVVSPEGSRTLLVRAVGPTLGTVAGLTGTLPDPKVTIHRHEGNGTSTPLLSNDDWGVGADAATTAAVSAQLGAFSLPADSKDAAFVVTLPPGVYTAVASGVGGATGTVLVEVYEVP